MLINKFEIKSKRVKGLCFHPTKPWILVSLHNGIIQLFDYRVGVIIEKFSDHEGPVRSVDFHRTQPLFTSAGDDQKIRVWDYNKKKCLFILSGHIDYIRMVKFHHELPWIISTSDDQTIRLWNWQNRSNIAVLTGHTHYVMSAEFHPEDNLILSSSLDNKVYVWDYSELKEKHQKYAGDSKKNDLMYTGTEVEVKHICEGHEKGVNFACFHPSRGLIASGADDKLIKLWRMSGSRAWELDTLKGHQNNVSCVAFHPKLDVLVSNSEDRTMKVWDLNARTCIYTLKKDTERFWVLAMHPTSNYFACGYDKGMSVFKLESERFDHARVGNQLFYVKNKVLMVEDLTNMESLPQANLEIEGKAVLNNQPCSLNYNHFDTSNHDVILNYKGDLNLSILVLMNKTLDKTSTPIQRKIESSKGAVFIAKEKICVLSKSRNLVIYLFDGRNKKIEWNTKHTLQGIFQATIGKVLLKSNNDVLLFDIAARKVVAEVQFPKITRVFWSPNMSHVALFSKDQIMICTKNLKPLCIVKETTKIKSGCFDNENGFIYSTYSHIKYLLVSDKMSEDSTSSNISGIFKATKSPVYVSGFVNGIVFYINREGKVSRETVNTSEYELKVALNKRKINEVIQILKRGQLSGNSVIQYLKEENCADIALLFEKDPKNRFSLALSSGNIQEAYKNAAEIQEKETYLQLSEQSMLQGYANVAEKSYQSLKAFNKLSFFYATQGCTSKLKRMQSIAMEMNNKNDIFENSILLGNVRDRVKLLMQSSQIALAYTTAKTHNLTDLIPLIEQEIQNRDLELVDNYTEQVEQRARKAKALLPCRPVFIEDESFTTANWPHTMLLQSNLQDTVEETETQDTFYDATATGDSSGQGISDLLEDTKEDETKDNLVGEEAAHGDDMDLLAGDLDGEDNWQDNDGIDLDEDLLGELEEDEVGADPDLADLDNEINQKEEDEVFIPPTRSNDPLLQLVSNSMVPAHHVAIGNFKEALNLLRKQIGLSNPKPLRSIFTFVHTNSKISLPTLPKFPSINSFLRTADGKNPVGIIDHEFLKKIYKEGFSEVTKGHFNEALVSFQKCLQHAVLAVATTTDEEQEIKKLINNCVEYIIAMRIELKRRDKDLTTTTIQNLELV